jgi:hypothetical protein
MARSLDLPTRVMVGFTPGKKGTDGLYHVAGRHAHAWDEVWFDGYGWVLFDPTPGRGAPGAEQHTGEVAAQQEGNAPAGNTPDNAPVPSVTNTTIPRDRPERFPTGTTTPRKAIVTSASDGGSPGGWIVPGVALAIIAWVIAMPRVLSRWSRRRDRDPADRVTSAWAATVRSLTMAGSPRVSGATPVEYARSVSIGKAEAIEVARLVTRAVYSPRGVDASAAARSEMLRTEVDSACRARMSLATRLRDHLDPRSAWRRITG